MGWKCLESLGGDELVHFHFFGSLKLFMFFLTQPTFGNLDTLSLQGTDEKGLTIFEQLFSNLSHVVGARCRPPHKIVSAAKNCFPCVPKTNCAPPLASYWIVAWTLLDSDCVSEGLVLVVPEEDWENSLECL